jgi:hypothetical protein
MVTPTRDNIYTGLLFRKVTYKRYAASRLVEYMYECSIFHYFCLNHESVSTGRVPLYGAANPICWLLCAVHKPAPRRCVGWRGRILVQIPVEILGFCFGMRASPSGGSTGADPPDVPTPSSQHNLFLVKCRLSTCSTLYSVERRTRATKTELYVFRVWGQGEPRHIPVIHRLQPSGL